MDQFVSSLKAPDMNQVNSDSEFDSDDDKSIESDNSSSETSKNVTKTDDMQLRLNTKNTKYVQKRRYELDDIQSKETDIEEHSDHQESKVLANADGEDERLISNTNTEEEARDQQEFFSSTSNNSDHDKLSSQETETSQMSSSHALTISDIINTDNLDLNKSVELADIIDSSEFSQDKSDIIDSDIVDQSELIDSNELINDEESKDFPKSSPDDIDFDITEKLREMGEISVNPVKKGSESSQKRNDESEDEVSVEIARKPGDGIEDEDGQSSAERKVGNLRRNIREVMDDQQLDAATLSAQKQEMERLARVQEQQRIIREVQRQIALNRQNNKTQTRVISLLQGNTSVLKQASSVGQRVSIPGTGTVLVKIPGKGLAKPDKARLGKSGAHITPSVSIAPVKVPPKPTSQTDDTSGSETEAPAPKKVKKDVVTIVDSSSDDDCILLSDDGEQEEEPEEDTQNSGLHVNDAYNCPDEQGRVVINIGHPEGESDIFLAPQIARVIKPHQIGGVRFLFDNIIESSERFNYSTGFGCILAHSMGLGKTLQLVCFCDIFLRHTTSKTVLCIMPINTLQNWMAEFNMWLPLDGEASTLKIHGEVRPRNFNLHVLNDSHKTLAARAKVVQDWRKDGGVLLIGYELYRLLSLKKMCKKKKKRGKQSAKQEEEDNEDIEANKLLLDEMHEALVKPGPDLVVCDEGHRIKNSHASISLALKQIRSKRRIVLTGYPLQNNLQEYWCMVDFVRPNYLGTKTEFANMFERPIQNGQCIDSTPQDIRLMRYRAHVLHSLLLGFVQRRSHAVLQTSLPQKEEYVLLVRMTPFQRKLYDTFMNDVVRTKAVPNPLKAFAVCCKIWNHPDVLFHFLRKREAAAVDIDLDLDETTTETSSVAGSSRTSVSPAAPKKGRGRNAPKGTKKEKKGKANTSQVQPFANSNTNVGSKPAATITPNSSNVVSENSNTSMEIEQPVVNPPILTSSPKHMEPTDNNQQYTPQGIPESQPLQTDYSQPPVTDFNYHNNQSYQQPYSQNYYPPTNIKDDYRNNQYSVNPNQQYSDAYAPYSQNMNYGGQQNYWNHNNYYPSMEYNNWNPEYGNNMYGNPNQYDNRFPYMDNIKQEDKTWNTLEHENQYNPEKVQVKQEVDHSKFGDVKLEPLEDETILELKPIIPKEKQEPVVADQLKTEEKEMGIPEDMNKDKIIEEMDAQSIKLPKEEGIPYDWAIELLKGYAAGVIENSAKMEIFFCILEESIKLGDRILVFSQSLFTLNLIEDFLHKNNVPGTENKWAKNVNYYRLDGSTSALEREKLINEFNSNPNIHIFLVSTRAGSLGINLVGANRVIVFDASWNPCHDTQAVCRVYRYGQKKPCFVYRLVMDNSLEKKIYDRQINKQGMADRVVDECNPDAHLSLKEVTNLCWDDEQDAAVSDFSHAKDKYIDVVMQKVVEAHSHTLSKEPFQHESLLIDRKEKKLSQAEKRLAQRGYELEKQAATRPTYSYSSGTGLQYRTVRTPDGAIVHRPVASVRPMQADNGERSGTSRPGGARPTRWIPAEVWQRQGMTAQEMTLPLDVVIPTSSVEKSNIVLKAGQKVMVLKSPKGIYMQLESGKIIAIRTAFKVGQGNKSGSTDAAAKDGPPGAVKKGVVRTGVSKISPAPNLPGNLKHNTSITVIPTKQSINLKGGVTAKGSAVPILNRKDNIKLSLQGKAGVSRNVGADKQLGTARPYNLNRGKLQVKSITKSIGNILNVSKPKEVPPPVDSEQETSNAGSSSSKDGDSSNSIKIDDGEMEQGEKCNALENSDSQANPVDITIPSMSQLASTPEDDIIATETSHSSASEESASINMKCEESSHTLDLDSVSTIEGTLNESSNMDAYPVENANANVSDDLAIKRPTSVVNVVDDTMSMQSSTNMPVESAPVLPREKVVYRPNLVERRPKPATTSLQRTSLKNYRHKSSHKQTLVSNTSVNSPMSSGVHLGESSLSQLEKSTTALSNESNNRFQSSLTNITSSYTPTMETLKRDSVKDTHGNSKKMKYNNSDTESTLEDKSGTSSGSLTAKRSTVTNLDEKPMDRYAIENTTPQLEEGKNVINLDDKNDSSLNNFTSNEFTIANNYPKHTSHTMVNPQRLQETNNESLQQQFTDCTNNTESNVIPPSNISQHPLHVQQTPILPQPPQSQLNMHSHPQLSQSPHPQIPNSQTLHPQIQQSQSQSPQVQPPQGQQPVQAHPPQAQPPHGQIQPPHLQLSHPQPPHPHPSQPPHPQPPHSQHYPPYAGGYSYPSNWGAPPSESTMYPNYDPSYSPLFHGHSAFHRPEPLPVPVPGADVNQPGSYPIHPYPPHPTTPSSQPSTYTGNQNTSAPNMTTGAPPAPNSHQSYGPPQNYPPQNYPGQNPVPNYPIPGQNLNPYPGFAGQPIPPYGQFGGNFSPAPMNQAPYNTRPMYPTPDYTGSGYGTSGAYAPYPPQTTNQWGQ